MTDVVLKINNLSLGYRVGKHETLEVVHDVSLNLRAARVVGLAGESGSGKSTLAKAAMGWRAGNAAVTGGSVEFGGQDLLTKRPSELRQLWGRHLAYVPQDVASALNPSRRVGSQLDETLKLHTTLRPSERRDRLSGVLSRVSVPSDASSLSRYPFEFSGGQQQRIAIALAMLCDPAVLILDEPTTGIDAALRVEVFSALRELLAGRETAVLYISHDLAEIASIADDLGVMYAGQIVEYGPAKEVFDDPLHPYSSALRAAVPDINDDSMVTGIAGRPPTGTIRDGCAFAQRCPLVISACVQDRIEMTNVSSTRRVRCIRATGASRRDEGWRRGRRLVQTELKGSPILAGQEITAVYRLPQGGVRIGVKSVTISLQEGETLGIVGESGSGKSTLLRCLAGIHPVESGEIWFRGATLPSRGQDRALAEHRAIQLVFQNPDRSLNPRHSVGRILGAPLRLYEPEQSDQVRRKRVKELLDIVQLPGALVDRFPHQLSGGEKQRVALARAYAASPRVLLCDEVVSALDVSVQATVMNLVKTYASETGAAVLFVSHDLAVVRMMSDRVMVMRSGAVCEQGATAALFMNPQHAYTRELLAAVIRREPGSTASGTAEAQSLGPARSGVQ